MDVLRAAARYLQRPAVVSEGITFRYADLLEGAATVSGRLLQADAFRHGDSDHATGPRVAIAAQPGPQHVAGTWGAWLAGGVPVPLCLSHPPKQLAYMLQDSGSAVVLATQQHAELLRPVAQSTGTALQIMDAIAPRAEGNAPSLGPFIAEAFQRQDRGGSDQRAALFIYTSGTTGAPKGVVHTHASLAAQIAALVAAWEWTPEDRLLHALPLHHIHGAVVGMHTPHAAGACVEFLPRFSPAAVWDCLTRRHEPVSVFMGVPTMYDYMLRHHGTLPADQQAAARHAAAALRLTVSGSAPLPLRLFEAWRELAGQPLLERYGMTEAGMLLSNPLHGERRPGSVGQPLPGVSTRLAPVEADSSSADSGDGNSRSSSRDGDGGGDGSSSPAVSGEGELQVRGPNLFREYWRRPEATADAFTPDGWFRTGDTAALQGGHPPAYSIRGRTSVDMITSGGYRISALELENVLGGHPGVAEAAVLGAPHERLGEQVVALVARSDAQLDAAALQGWAAGEVAPYQVPKRIEFVDALPRNAMGKINKKEVLRDFFS